MYRRTILLVLTLMLGTYQVVDAMGFRSKSEKQEKPQKRKIIPVESKQFNEGDVGEPKKRHQRRVRQMKNNDAAEPLSPKAKSQKKRKTFKKKERADATEDLSEGQAKPQSSKNKRKKQMREGKKRFEQDPEREVRDMSQENSVPTKQTGKKEVEARGSKRQEERSEPAMNKKEKDVPAPHEKHKVTKKT